MPSPAEFARVSPGVYRRADGVEIRRMKGYAVRELMRGAVWCTGDQWVAFDAQGCVMYSHYPAYVGGASLVKARERLDRHERKTVQVVA